ncbi:putative coiled-coil domain containing 13 [Operophtera brumata]|uniref:Putative coiled-coil domain containing 13 n=1 Tax=Operophtera brumata TaxID=104452 RepID=A0A0L7LPI2_OPEBR|nr:putative coiled-coil domain containing 13 [Operophtera brumata]
MDKNKNTSGAKAKPNIKEDKLGDLSAKIDETDEMKLKMLAALEKPEPEDLFELNQRIRDIISGTGPAISSKSAGIISAKITELCKQNRHLVAEVEGYKTKNATMERKLMQFEIINHENEKLDICLCKDEPIDASPDELKELNCKLSVVNKKLYDSKNRNLELKNDILLATKILQQELGDKFTSIKELQNDVAGWKGRAQQIVLLQAKVSDLEEKLTGVIREIEMRRKKEVDRAMKELETLREENHELKKKLDGARCRIRNLECDSTTLRQKMQTFMEKSTHDDLLINEQRSQIKTSEVYYQEILKENTTKMNKLNSEVAEYQKLISNTDAKIDAMRKQSTEKASKIEELRAQLLRYEECSLQSVFFTPMKTATDNEIKKLSDLVITLNDRLDEERRKWEELEINHRKIKEKKRRLERKVKSLEEEVKTYKDSRRGSRMSKASLAKETQFELFGATSVTRKQSSITAIAEKPSESTSSESQPTEGYAGLDKEDLMFKLELTEEKLKIMEDKLKMIEEEKQDDYNHLTDMIQTSKQLFNEALAVLQREKCEKTVYPTEELKCLDKRIAENTKLQSNVTYHADFEKSKGKFTQTLRIRANTRIISNVTYHGDLEKKAQMEKQRQINENGELVDVPTDYHQQIDNCATEMLPPPHLPPKTHYQTPVTQYQSQSYPQSYQPAPQSTPVSHLSQQNVQNHQQQHSVSHQNVHPPSHQNVHPHQKVHPSHQNVHPAQNRQYQEQQHYYNKPKEDYYQYQDYPQDYQQNIGKIHDYDPLEDGPRAPLNTQRASSTVVYNSSNMANDKRANDNDEVSFREGDLISNVSSIDEGWMTGQVLRTGRAGMLPANYVAECPPQHAHQY